MKKILKRGMSGLLAVLMAFTVLAGFGTTTAFAASETAESYMISFPRDGDAAQIYSEDAWGHSAKKYMNGWATGSSNYTTLHCMDSFDGKVCYCIEPGLSRNVGDTYYGFGEDFWDNYPSQYNNTIEPDDIMAGAFQPGRESEVKHDEPRTAERKLYCQTGLFGFQRKSMQQR